MDSATRQPHRFAPGVSGNPKGRPPGSSNLVALRAAIGEQMGPIIASLVVKASKGDVQAARLLLERVLPRVKLGQPYVVVSMPDEFMAKLQRLAGVKPVRRKSAAKRDAQPSQGAQ